MQVLCNQKIAKNTEKSLKNAKKIAILVNFCPFRALLGCQERAENIQAVGPQNLVALESWDA